MNLYELKENRIMRPKTFSAMLSNLLYERRFGPYFIEPVIAGLDPYDNQPYVCNMDLVGFLTYTKNSCIYHKTRSSRVYWEIHIITLMGLLNGLGTTACHR